MKKLSLTFLRMMAQIFILVGILGSFFYVVDAEHYSNSIFLKFLFTIWVLLPLFSLLIANVLSRSWSAITRAALYLLIMLVTLVSLVCYSGIFAPRGINHSNTFIITPLVSWLFIATIMPIAAKVADKRRS